MTLSFQSIKRALFALTAVLVLATLQLSAQINSTDFQPNNLTVNGNAAWVNNNTVLRLTPNSTTQVGSAWFNTAQQVTITGGFSTTFTFQISGANAELCGETPCPADGFAFLVQNAPTPLNAIGPDGCGIGFGGNVNCTNGSGITNSLAVEFDTFNNGATDDNSGNHVAIQSCPSMGANTSDLTASPSCTIANNAKLNVTLADGNPHTVTITYSGPTGNLLDVILDNQDLFPGGVAFDLSTLGLGNNGTGYVGFTASTGGADDNQDILSWSLKLPAQSAVVTQGQTAVLSFSNNAFNYNAQLTAGNPVTATVQPILISEEACEQLVNVNFPITQCFVYQNAGGAGQSSSVLLELTCPQSPGGTCGNNVTPFSAELGSNFSFLYSQQEFFIYPGIAGPLNPFPGWLKGEGPDPAHPCTPYPGNNPPLFQSNQIDTFSVVGDPGGKTVGRSGGTGSCWVATYATWGEVPPGIKSTSPTVTTYTQNQVVNASYTCSNPASSKNPATSPVGPYLTVATCTQTQSPEPNPSFNTNTCTSAPGTISCTGPVDTSILGIHVFTILSTDSGGNQAVKPIIYVVSKKK